MEEVWRDGLANCGCLADSEGPFELGDLGIAHCITSRK